MSVSSLIQYCQMICTFVVNIFVDMGDGGCGRAREHSKYKTIDPHKLIVVFFLYLCHLIVAYTPLSLEGGSRPSSKPSSEQIDAPSRAPSGQ